MITDENIENKAKGKKAAKPKMVKVKLKPFRAIKGLGKPGDVVEVESDRANYIVGTGYGLFYDEATMAVSKNPF